MNRRYWNWRLWVGFALCPIAILSYFLVFYDYPVTRDVPWVSFLIFAGAAILLFAGLRRAFAQPEQYRGKIFGSVVATLGMALLGIFCVFIFYLSRQLPISSQAPRVGSRAPDFVLPDATNQPISLTSLLTDRLPQTQAPPKGLVLVFYRGYW